MPNIHNNHSRRSDLFVLRIWRNDTYSTEVSIEGEGEEGTWWRWRGRIQRAVSGEAHMFQGWPALIELLEAMLCDTRSPSGGGGSTEMRETTMTNPILKITPTSREKEDKQEAQE